MKLSISETEHVVTALADWATVNMYDKELFVEIKRLHKRFNLSLAKKKGWDKSYKEFLEKQEADEEPAWVKEMEIIFKEGENK